MKNYWLDKDKKKYASIKQWYTDMKSVPGKHTATVKPDGSVERT